MMPAECKYFRPESGTSELTSNQLYENCTSQNLVDEYFHMIFCQQLRRHYDLMQIRLHQITQHQTRGESQSSVRGYGTVTPNSVCITRFM